MRWYALTNPITDTKSSYNIPMRLWGQSVAWQQIIPSGIKQIWPLYLITSLSLTIAFMTWDHSFLNHMYNSLIHPPSNTPLQEANWKNPTCRCYFITMNRKVLCRLLPGFLTTIRENNKINYSKTKIIDFGKYFSSFNCSVTKCISKKPVSVIAFRPSGLI